MKINDYRQPVYINPLTDFGFKRLFFTELNKELLIDFLNGILPEEDRVVDIEYQPTDSFGPLEGDRKAIFDIFCTNEKGEYLIVEMQRAKQPNFHDRSLFYAAHPIIKQAPKGKWDFNLKAVYFIGILDFVLFKDGDGGKGNYLEYVNLIRQSTNTIYSKKLNLIFVELPKFAKTEAELSTNADRWMYCLRNLSVLDSRPAAVQGRIFEKLFKEAEIKKLTTVEMDDYKKSVLEYDDVQAAINCAKDEAREEAREEALKEGEKKGREVGREEGRREMAINCLKKGMPIEEISDLTGLSPEQIEQLKA